MARYRPSRYFVPSGASYGATDAAAATAADRKAASTAAAVSSLTDLASGLFSAAVSASQAKKQQAHELKALAAQTQIQSLAAQTAAYQAQAQAAMARATSGNAKPLLIGGAGLVLLGLIGGGVYLVAKKKRAA